MGARKALPPYTGLRARKYIRCGREKKGLAKDSWRDKYPSREPFDKAFSLLPLD